MLSAKRPSRDPRLDFMRAIAIFLTLFYHSAGPLIINLQAISPGLTFGWIGVDMFFVLSGFLVGGLLIGEFSSTGQLHAKRFLIRRAWKIWPVYYVYLAAELALLLATHNRKEALESLPNWIHLQNYLGSPFAHTWSLAVEEHFYLVLALGFGALLRPGVSFKQIAACLLGVMGLVLVYRTVSIAIDPKLLHDSFSYTHTRIDGLCFGVLLAATYHLRPDAFEKIAGQRLLLGAIAVVAWIYVIAFPRQSAPIATVGLTVCYLGCGALLLLAFRPTSALWVGFERSVAYRGLAWVGQLSYSIYLWQFVIGKRMADFFLHHVHPGIPAWIAAVAISSMGAVLSGWLSFVLIERPTLKLRDRLFPSSIRQPKSEDAEPILESIPQGKLPEATQG